MMLIYIYIYILSMAVSEDGSLMDTSPLQQAKLMQPILYNVPGSARDVSAYTFEKTASSMAFTPSRTSIVMT